MSLVRDIARRISYGYPAPTLTDGRPTDWAPDSVITGEFGTFRIEFGATWLTGVKTADGVDYTDYRGAPTLIESLTWGEPWGEISGELLIPAATIFDDLSWLASGVNVDVYRVLGAADAVTYARTEVPYWHGFVASVEVADSADARTPVRLHLLGACFGEASLRAHQPVMDDPATAPDIGSRIGNCLDPLAYSRPFNPFRFAFTADTTGITSRYRGSRGAMTVDYVDELLGLAQNPSGQWTIGGELDVDGFPVAHSYVMRLKAADAGLADQVNTISAGGYGVSLTLTEDITTNANAIYGVGQAEDGSRWANMKYPMLSPTPLSYPGTMSATPGENTDADFGYDAVTALQARLRASGWPDVQITGTWTTATTTALEASQEDGGWTVTGEINNSTDWTRVWATGSGYTDLASAYQLPLSRVAEADYYLYTSDGDVTGDNDTGVGAYDGRIRVDRVVAYGEKVSKSRARIHARRLATAAITPTWSGTCILTADPAERSRLAIREGSWLRILNVAGSYRDFYIAGVAVGTEAAGWPVTLTISTQAFDLLDLSTRLERDREAAQNPASSFYALRNRTSRPMKDVTGWDKESGAGIVHTLALSTGWNVIKMVGAQRGTVAAVDCRTMYDPQRFALAVFGSEIDAAGVAAIVANPLADETSGYGWWSLPANQDALTAASFVEAWGEFENAAGYWPGAETNDPASTLSGRLVDELSWNFVSADAPFLWVAVYATAACQFRAEFRVIVDES